MVLSPEIGRSGSYGIVVDVEITTAGELFTSVVVGSESGVAPIAEAIAEATWGRSDCARGVNHTKNKRRKECKTVLEELEDLLAPACEFAGWAGEGVFGFSGIGTIEDGVGAAD